ncbi:uncharacterized protein mkrn2os.2 isoform X2 [Phycodurus eques]|uniref:uncharacterized protein mkrn2os.2 isoform X2 n=1 Tax=Phycodurus eques TaxID=693459 RepID=UPI002ACDB327|nr:uncharacterized protein mkrn2os.2 isoform X2 [Phycodurus eques]
MEEPGVIRVRHECLKDVFCFSLPQLCPACGERLAGRRLREPPVSIPNPLCDGYKTPCCLLVAPADRNADRDFDGTSELHTGIANTSGVVYNYTERGVVRDQSGWLGCVSVPLVRPDTFHLLAQWDRYLEQFSRGPLWDPTWHRSVWWPSRPPEVRRLAERFRRSSRSPSTRVFTGPFGPCKGRTNGNAGARGIGTGDGRWTSAAGAGTGGRTGAWRGRRGAGTGPAVACSARRHRGLGVKGTGGAECTGTRECELGKMAGTEHGGSGEGLNRRDLIGAVERRVRTGEK